MTSPVSMPAGHAILAADLDAYENLTAVWTAYSPSWTAASVNPAIGNGVILANYVRAGKFVVATVRIIMGSTTTYGTGVYSVSVPFASQGALQAAGSCFLSDSSAGAFMSATVAFTGSASAVTLAAATAGVSATNPFTFATSDEIKLAITYEAA